MGMERPAAASPERPRNESRADLHASTRDAEDLRWGTKVKGFVTYWVDRLKDDFEVDLPDALRAVVDREAARAPGAKAKFRNEELPLLNDFVNARLVELRDRPKAKPTEALEAVVAEAADVIAHATETMEAPLEAPLAPETKTKEEEDEAHAFGSEDFFPYWLMRLAEDPEGLPDRVRGIVSSGSADDQIEKQAIKRYVTDRLRAQSFGRKKREEMGRLRAELRRIDDGEAREAKEGETTRALSFDDASGAFYVAERGGKRFKVTEGDVVADMIWGVHYAPDASLPPDQWRRIRKLSAVRESRGRIQDLWNRELAEREGLDLPASSLSAEFIEEHPQAGVVAERIAQTLLTRIQFDHPESGLKVEASNTAEDIYLKYDFKVLFSERKRGVQLTDEDPGTRETYVDEKRRLGIQFTMNTERETQEHKKRQVAKAKRQIDDERFREMVPRPVDDIVLVTVPLERISQMFKRWIDDGRPSGGPERYLSKEQKLALLSGITRGIAGFDSGHLERLLP